MNHPTSLTLENVRCFAGAQTGQIRRVTLLVGENSTGKSTFLGCYKAFSRLSSFFELDDRNYFDDKPFRLGAFATIARDGCVEFAVEGSFRGECYESIRLEYCDGGDSYPGEAAISIPLANTAQAFRIKRTRGAPEIWRLEGPGFLFDLDKARISGEQFTTWLSRSVMAKHLPFRGDTAELRKQESPVSAERQSTFAKMINFLVRPPLPTIKQSADVVAPSPATSDPQRQYGPLPYPIEQTAVVERVADMGSQTGLFSGIKATPRGPDGMTEVLVEMPDGWRNIVDIGYGIHSVLPVLFQMCARGDDATFLLQQPEIHIHPTAQAALATVMAKSEQRFLIETHSDHLIDRFRIGVMRGDMEPEDLQILYFEKASDGKSSKIHSIGVDKNGNLRDVPYGYRKFFLDETHRLLGFRK